MRIWTGADLDILNLTPDQIDIHDIATHLSRIARWNGATATERMFTVAEHSVGVSNLCPTDLALWGLLHDAGECFIGDIITPLKADIQRLADIERHILFVISHKFGLPWPMPEAVKQADRFMLGWESRDYLDPPMFKYITKDHRGLQRLPEPADEIAARMTFMARFNELTDDFIYPVGAA